MTHDGEYSGLEAFLWDVAEQLYPIHPDSDATTVVTQLERQLRWIAKRMSTVRRYQ